MVIIFFVAADLANAAAAVAQAAISKAQAAKAIQKQVVHLSVCYFINTVVEFETDYFF